MIFPTVSIVIPTYGRAAYLKDLIQSIRTSAPSVNYEIVIVSSDKEDTEKVHWMKAQEDITLIMSDPELKPNSKRKRSLYYYTNLGIKAAKNEWALIVNDDMVFDKDWYTEFCSVISDPLNEGAGMVIASSHLGDVELGNRIVKIGRTKKKNEDWKDLYLADVAFIKVDILKRIGYFDENQDWFGSGLDNALALEFLTESKTINAHKVIITHFITEENRASRRGKAFYDFSYLFRKWNKWCKENDAAWECDLGINPNNIFNRLRYDLHIWRKNRNI